MVSYMSDLLKEIHPDNLKCEPYEKAIVACEITEHELKTWFIFLKSLEDAELFEDQKHLYTLVCSNYRTIYERFTERNGSVITPDRRKIKKITKMLSEEKEYTAQDFLKVLEHDKL